MTTKIIDPLKHFPKYFLFAYFPQNTLKMISNFSVEFLAQSPLAAGLDNMHRFRVNQKTFSVVTFRHWSYIFLVKS